MKVDIEFVDHLEVAVQRNSGRRLASDYSWVYPTRGIIAGGPSGIIVESLFDPQSALEHVLLPSCNIRKKVGPEIDCFWYKARPSVGRASRGSILCSCNWHTLGYPRCRMESVAPPLKRYRKRCNDLRSVACLEISTQVMIIKIPSSSRKSCYLVAPPRPIHQVSWSPFIQGLRKGITNTVVPSVIAVLPTKLCFGIVWPQSASAVKLGHRYRL